MGLIEMIADKQTKLSERDWKPWCNRLEQTLIQAGDSEEFEVFRKMNLNPLSVLKRKSFRPSYSKSCDNSCHIYYLKMLERVENRLQLNNLSKL